MEKKKKPFFPNNFILFFHESMSFFLTPAPPSVQDVIDAVNPQTPAWIANVTAGSTLVFVNGVATKGAEMADILSQCT